MALQKIRIRSKRPIRNPKQRCGSGSIFRISVVIPEDAVLWYGEIISYLVQSCFILNVEDHEGAYKSKLFNGAKQGQKEKSETNKNDYSK